MCLRLINFTTLYQPHLWVSDGKDRCGDVHTENHVRETRVPVKDFLSSRSLRHWWTCVVIGYVSNRGMFSEYKESGI